MAPKRTTMPRKPISQISGVGTSVIPEPEKAVIGESLNQARPSGRASSRKRSASVRDTGESGEAGLAHHADEGTKRKALKQPRKAKSDSSDKQRAIDHQVRSSSFSPAVLNRPSRQDHPHTNHQQKHQEHGQLSRSAAGGSVSRIAPRSQPLQTRRGRAGAASASVAGDHVVSVPPRALPSASLPSVTASVAATDVTNESPSAANMLLQLSSHLAASEGVDAKVKGQSKDKVEVKGKGKVAGDGKGKSKATKPQSSETLGRNTVASLESLSQSHPQSRKQPSASPSSGRGGHASAGNANLVPYPAGYHPPPAAHGAYASAQIHAQALRDPLVMAHQPSYAAPFGAAYSNPYAVHGALFPNAGVGIGTTYNYPPGSRAQPWLSSYVEDDVSFPAGHIRPLTGSAMNAHASPTYMSSHGGHALQGIPVHPQRQGFTGMQNPFGLDLRSHPGHHMQVMTGMDVNMNSMHHQGVVGMGGVAMPGAPGVASYNRTPPRAYHIGLMEARLREIFAAKPFGLECLPDSSQVFLVTPREMLWNTNVKPGHLELSESLDHHVQKKLKEIRLRYHYLMEHELRLQAEFRIVRDAEKHGRLHAITALTADYKARGEALEALRAKNVFKRGFLGMSAKLGFSKQAHVELFTALFGMFQHPYPSSTEFEVVASRANIAYSQVVRWFQNMRKRIWKQLVLAIQGRDPEPDMTKWRLKPTQPRGKIAAGSGLGSGSGSASASGSGEAVAGGTNQTAPSQQHGGMCVPSDLVSSAEASDDLASPLSSSDKNDAT
ncbi:hypothetical protein FVE85_8639 [Porphyridium purpureum]|uniref:Homeobox domain-containing protein n=1 Tax=Porphyridium purpureum TaxID=35688 RepID=A0A5J4YR47_PORPP|nr:hypothetical protein FVE85_8639 [Porphyridium purpureum]|eukprot:POR9115..scf296_7